MADRLMMGWSVGWPATAEVIYNKGWLTITLRAMVLLLSDGKAIDFSRRWLQVTKAAHWTRFHDVRQVFRTADEVRVDSGVKVVVFNVGNGFRLLTAIHYNRLKVYVMRFLTHAEYDKE